MKFRWLVICTIMLCLPTILYASWSKNRVKIENETVGAVIFNHNDHFDYLGERICTDCHHDIFYIDTAKNPDFTMQDMEEGKSCGACHNDERAFSVTDSCSSCHPTKEVTFEVPDIGPVAFSHDVHTSMFDCSSCHPDLFIPGPGNDPVSMDEMAEGESCGACHDDSTAFSVEENCEACHQM